MSNFPHVEQKEFLDKHLDGSRRVPEYEFVIDPDNPNNVVIQSVYFTGHIANNEEFKLMLIHKVNERNFLGLPLDNKLLSQMKCICDQEINLLIAQARLVYDPIAKIWIWYGDQTTKKSMEDFKLFGKLMQQREKDFKND